MSERSIVVKCPECGKGHSVPMDRLGQGVSCQACGGEVVPASSTPAPTCVDDMAGRATPEPVAAGTPAGGGDAAVVTSRQAEATDATTSVTAPPPADAPPAGVFGDEERTVVTGDVMEAALDALDRHERLQQMFGLPVTRSLRVVADGGDLRIEADPALSLTSSQEATLLAALDEVFAATGADGVCFDGPIRATCPRCKRAMEVGAETIGQAVSCPGCASSFVVAEPSAAREDLDELLRVADKEVGQVGVMVSACIWAAVGLLVLVMWGTSGFFSAIGTGVVLGFAGFSLGGLWMTRKQKQLVDRKYRAPIRELAGAAGLARSDLPGYLASRAKELSDVW